MNATRLQVERLEDRNTPSCTASSFYGDWASSAEPSSIGVGENAAGAHYWQDQGDPAVWGEVNMVFGLVHGCD